MADVLAKLSALSDRFKGEPMTSVQADMMLNLIPRELLEKILSDSGGSLAEFQDVAIDILGTLLPSCSNDTLEKHYSLAPLLLHRLRTSEGMDSLNEISGCILSLYKLGSHNQEKYLHDTADVLSSYCVNNSQDFPFTCILHRLTECIANLRSSSENYELVCSHHCWPTNTRTLVERVLKTRTEMITEDTRFRILQLVEEVMEALGGKWFAPDLSLLLLLVHIVVVQVRMCLDKPDTINSQSLAVCYHILEMAIECVEESSLLDDSMATRLAATVREAAFYSIEYWVEAKEQEEHLNESVELILYRFVSCFLSIGGAEMLPSPLMEKCSPLLLQVFQREAVSGNYSVAHLLLPNLNSLPKLSENVISLLVELVVSQYSSSEGKDALDEVTYALESLGERVDYYSALTLSEARSKLEKTIPNCKLSEVLAKL